MKKNTFAQRALNKVKKECPKTEICEISQEDYYNHPTFVIESLTEYIQLVTTISKTNKDDLAGDTVIFRGIADSKFDLLPGLSRIKNLDTDTESDLLNGFLTRRPDAFAGLNDFDIMAKMQHYGLPTRLLDFSQNPLVALYFACESNSRKEGRVLCHNTYLKRDSELLPSKICSVALRKKFDDAYTADEYLCDEKLTLLKYLREVYLYEETTVIRPKYWNQRIANQAGLFMLFPNNLIDRYKAVLTHANCDDLAATIRNYAQGFVDEELIRDILCKESIEQYKDESGLYVTDKHFELINDTYKQDDGKIHWENSKAYFENRFRMACSLKEIDRRIIEQNFCSIIIKPKDKQSILRDLSYIGISVDYIYPELEYSAKEIKKFYT